MLPEVRIPALTPDLRDTLSPVGPALEPPASAGDAGLHYAIHVGAQHKAATVVEDPHAVAALDAASLRVGTAQVE